MHDWFDEIDPATGMDDLNHAGFVVSKHHVKLETLDLQIAKANMTDFMRKIRLWDEKTRQEGSAQCHRQASCASDISFIGIFESQGQTTSVNDLLHMELHSDNLKMFNQTWEETRRI